VWAQDNKYGKRINASLEAIQFVRHGEAFGAKPVIAEEVFDDLGGDDDGGASAAAGSKGGGAPWDDANDLL
jgi:hypothetical protein